MSFKLKILGSASAIPAFGRNHTSQVLQIYNNYFLIDCGEGTQTQLKKYRVNINKIHSIFISHLHGDHFLGLFGLISTMNLLGRETPLNIFGPKGLDDIITTQLKYSNSILKFETTFTTTNPTVSEEIYNGNNVSITTIPLEHRIDCTGFLFKEIHKPRRINPDCLAKTNLSNSELKSLKEGKDILNQDGSIKHLNQQITLDPKKCRSYAYCSDTKFIKSLIPIIKDVDLLYHESTFLNKHKDRAAFTYHSTAEQAATIAKEANVNRLLLGHFSSRYKGLDNFLMEAKPIFNNSFLALEGDFFEVEH